MKCDINCKFYPMCWNVGEGICEVGEDCDRYEPERPHGEWIPCSERLPEESGFYLVTGKAWGGDGTWLWIVFYKKNKNLWASNGIETVIFKNEEILSWMPLPDPYQKEGEAE